MTLQHALGLHRPARLAWMVALLVVLRFGAWELHQSLDHHDDVQPCQVCLVLERTGDGAPVSVGKPLPVPTAEPLQTRQSLAPAAAAAPCPLPRGPPPSIA
jgi:hypothetical protein